MKKEKNILRAQKRVIKLKRRTINIGDYRKDKDYLSIIANKNKRITEEQIKSIKTDLLNIKGLTEGKLLKIFRIEIRMRPNKILTNKGILVRMGGGKAKPKTKVLYITKGTICIVLIPISGAVGSGLAPRGQSSSYKKSVITKLLNKFILKYSFFSYNYLL